MTKMTDPCKLVTEGALYSDVKGSVPNVQAQDKPTEQQSPNRKHRIYVRSLYIPRQLPIIALKRVLWSTDIYQLYNKYSIINNNMNT